jgi:Sulfotransferase family
MIGSAEPAKPRANWTGGNLIFLVSQPRAGSTLLQRILAAHPEIHSVPEPWIMLHPAYALHRSGLEAEFSERLAQRAVDSFLEHLPEREEAYLEGLRHFAAHLYGRALAGTGKSLFLDKTPRYYFILPELARIFPKARFIILLRNPLAVLASVLDTWAVRDNWNRLTIHRHDLLAAPRLLAEGIDQLGDRAQVARYEELVTRPEETVERLCQGLGLKYTREMLNYDNRAPARGEFGDTKQVHQFERPAADRLALWIDRLAQPHRRYFAEAYLDALGPELLARLGYPRDDLLASLRSRPSRRPGLIVAWATLMKPPEERTAWERFKVRAVIALRQRGVAGALLYGLRKVVGARLPSGRHDAGYASSRHTRAG